MAKHSTKRLPYVWDGDVDDLAVFIDGCYRSAQIDLSEADTYDWEDARRDRCLASAADWEARGQAAERHWLELSDGDD